MASSKIGRVSNGSRVFHCGGIMLNNDLGGGVGDKTAVVCYVRILYVDIPKTT